MSKETTGNQRGNSALIYAQEGFTPKYLFALVEDTYFGVLLSLQKVVYAQKLKRKNYVTAFFANLFDFLHIIPFLIHGIQYKLFSHSLDGFNFGEVTLAWGRFSNWVQLQLPIYRYSDFQVRKRAFNI
jgi:hypothetical protein